MGSLRACFVVLALALLAVACAPPLPAAATGVAADGWHDFQGSWDAAGSRRILPLGGERRATLIDLRGTLLLAGPGRPGVGFRGDVVALNDSATGLVGRAVWTDERGDQVYSELRGEGVAKGNRISGTFVGGTGRYSGAEGHYEFAWQHILESEDGVVQGRAVGLAGRVRAASRAAAKP